MYNSYFIIGFSLSLFIFLLLILTILFMCLPTSSNNSEPSGCKYNGPIPEPLSNEVIGAASDLTLTSTTSNTGFKTPCFVYFTEDMTYEKTSYGIRLPAGTYNVYIQYLSYQAVDGDMVVDNLTRTDYIGFNHNTLAQRQVGSRTSTFVDNQCISIYDGVVLGSYSNILRIASAIKGFSSQTLYVDRIEILFQKLLEE